MNKTLNELSINHRASVALTYPQVPERVYRSPLLIRNSADTSLLMGCKHLLSVYSALYAAFKGFVYNRWVFLLHELLEAARAVLSGRIPSLLTGTTPNTMQLLKIVKVTNQILWDLNECWVNIILGIFVPGKEMELHLLYVQVPACSNRSSLLTHIIKDASSTLSSRFNRIATTFLWMDSRKCTGNDLCSPGRVLRTDFC